MLMSVCVCTRNRFESLERCVHSIIASTYKKFELIVIDQSDDAMYKKNDLLIRKYTHKHFRDKGVGLTRARNIAIAQSSGEIIAFTDDDCIVSDDWISRIYFNLKNNSGIDALFGRIMPFQPQNNSDKYCPAVFQSSERKIFQNPHVIAYNDIGFGNNMAFKKRVFIKLGRFKTWLGPGSVSINGGEEGELQYRMLFNKFKISYEPNILVYHNRWLHKHDYEKLRMSYGCGNLAMITYLRIKYRDPWFDLLIKEYYLSPVEKFSNILSLKYHFTDIFLVLWFFILSIIYLFRGILIGSIAALLRR